MGIEAILGTVQWALVAGGLRTRSCGCILPPTTPFDCVIESGAHMSFSVGIGHAMRRIRALPVQACVLAMATELYSLDRVCTGRRVRVTRSGCKRRNSDVQETREDRPDPVSSLMTLLRTARERSWSEGPSCPRRNLPCATSPGKISLPLSDRESRALLRQA